MKEERSMKDDYLWDGSGAPDPEVERLEGLLKQFRSNRPAPDVAVPGFDEAADRRPRGWLEALRFRPWPRFAAVAATLLMSVAAWLVVRRSSLLGPRESSGSAESATASTPATNWEVSRLSGTPVIGSSRITGAGRLAVGQTLETDAASQASISVAEIGEVEVEPNTRLRLIEARDSRDWLALERGTIQVSIWAPPGQFVVDTPSATAVDLGCAYTLHVDDSGAGLLRTTLGWVGFKLNGRESFIPAGAVCATRPGIGPGTPCFDDASESFRDALTRLDFDTLTPEQRAAALDAVLGQARPRDALTLWHLLARTEGMARARVYARLAALVPPPQGVTRDGVLASDRAMLDLWWNALGYGDTSLWRTFERSWPPENQPSAPR
jgi:FecR-like protein